MNLLRKHDRRLFHLLNGKLRSPYLDRWMRTFTHLGGATCTISLMLLLPFFTQLSWRGIIALSFSHSVATILKNGFKRVRPYLRESSVIFLGKPLKDFSFPSGHTTAAFTCCLAIALTWSWLAFLVVPLAIIVGWSRIYLGFHYPADVAAGALIGSLTTWIVYWF